MLGQRSRDGLLLERAEVRLALVDEDVLDADALAGLDVLVGVTYADAEALAHDLRHGALACSGRSDEHGDRAQRCLRLAR